MAVRPLDELGCNIWGGRDTFGRPAAWLMRSWTTCRAR